jgi:hypothetical protein
VHAHVAAAVGPAAGDRPQHAGGPASRLLVGEDVVEVVVAAAAGGGQAAHVGALAIAVLELRLGLVVVLVFGVGIALFGEAEVDERAMPGVTQGHPTANISPLRANSCNYRSNTEPSRTTVAPSSTATA